MSVTDDRISTGSAASDAPLAEGWSPPGPSARPATVVRRGSVVALRQRQAIATGSLADRSAVVGDRLVTARDAAGQAWWIPAGAVWSDAGAPGHPEHPRPIGLATASTRESALLKGLSDRLGWEAVKEFERGRHLPAATGLAHLARPDLLLLDGRLGHEVPTVVILGAEMARWGAAATWDSAYRRAMFGDDASNDATLEFAAVSAQLSAGELAIAAVDLDTPLLRQAGIVRCSVQLVATNGVGRAWDANLVN